MHKPELIKKILNILQSEGFVNSIEQPNIFYDEPQVFIYESQLSEKNKYFNARGLNLKARGESFFSKTEGLIRCLNKTVEQISMYSYKFDSMIFSDFLSLTKTGCLNPSIYSNKKEDESRKYGWVKGKNLITNSYSYVPAQFISSDYTNRIFNDRDHYEPRLSENTSTLATSDFEQEKVILSGILEIIAQDAVMNVYLNRISPKRINPAEIKNKSIQLLLSSCQRYKLNWYLFDLTNDWAIPTFLTLLIDKTGLGPAITLCCKSNTNGIDAIIESMEKALSIRIRTRTLILSRKNNFVIKKTNNITTKIDRAIYWSSPSMLKHIDFLTEQKPQTVIFPYRIFDIVIDLKYVKNILDKNNIEVYYVDLTNELFKTLGYVVYKIIIPKLQPYYINENIKDLRKDRLKLLSKISGQKNFILNPIPHPFICT